MTKIVQLCLVIALLALVAFGFSKQNYSAQEHPNDLRLWVLNIGQGDSILIDTPTNQQILIDGGPGPAVLSELARVLPFNDKEIDLIISTHNDADHLKGLNDVLRHYKVGKVWLTGAVHTTQTYQIFRRLLEEKAVPTEIITAGTKADFGELHGISIWPRENVQGQTLSQRNSAGIVTFWQYGQTTFLLTADVESAQESAMIASGVLRPVNILKVGHHGSRTSSSEAFLQTIQPKTALISLGRSNSYGHPHPEILARLKQFNATIFRTDLSGRILCTITLVAYSCAGAR